MEYKSNYYNILKLLTTILVVIGHSTVMYTTNGIISPKSSSIFLANVSEFVYSFHMPLFICIAGMVYGFCIDDLKKYNNSFKFIKNKFVRLLLPYLFFGILYVAPVMCIFNFTTQSFKDYCINGILLVMNSRHLWYLIVLFEIFLVCLILKKAFQKINFFILIIPLLYLSYFSKNISGPFQIRYLFYYLIFFYLGYFFNKYYYSLIAELKKPYFMETFIFWDLIVYGSFLWEYKLVSAISGICIFITFTSYLPLVFFAKSKFYNLLVKNGFGIYLFHPMIIYIFYYYFKDLDINPIVFCSLVSMLSYFLSLLFTELLRHLTLKKIIGE